MSNQFDDVSKGLATSHSRRGMFKILGAGVAGAVLTAFRPKKADAANCLLVCRGQTGSAFTSCLKACSCTNVGWHPCGEGTSRTCCPPRTQCTVINDLQSTQVNGTIVSSRFCFPIPDYSQQPT